MVALLDSAKGGFRCSSAARAVVNQVTAAVEDKPGPATRRHLEEYARLMLYTYPRAGRKVQDTTTVLYWQRDPLRSLPLRLYSNH